MHSHRVGLTARGERMLNVAGIAVLALFAIGWSWSIRYANAVRPEGESSAPTTTRTVATALTTASAPTAAYLTNAALDALASSARGTSGKLRAKTVLPGKVDEALKSLTDFDLITLLPFGAKKNGRVGLYYIGNWPSERGARGPGKAPPDRYANPEGFIEVTPENQDTRVSEHFRLKDFLTHDQQGVWPKYLVLQMRNVDKLELVLEDLAGRGINTEGVVVMSGFRTPQYNVGGGNTGGRAGLSRHMYGDAADIYIDNDHNGVMDDLNHDGRVDIRDAKVIEESVDRVEREHPELIGGAGVYIACCGHGPFIHIDSRGYRARWTGSGGG
ncbi:MAG TPA: hypothetical protein VIF32_01865 [Gemmatimonadaceae bacterium]